MGSELDITLNDELEWSTIGKPRVDNEDEETATYARHFLDKWTEKGGIPLLGAYNAAKEEDDDDDIGATFTTTNWQLANTNRDIGRLIDNARLIVANIPNPPDIVVGHKMVLLDRARRVALGDARPAPMSLTQGLDGGVNRTLFRHRRPRPEDYRDGNETPKTKTTKTRRKDMLPRRRGDTGTKSATVLPARFSVKRPSTGIYRPNFRVIKSKFEINSDKSLRRNRTHNTQRVLAGYLLRQRFTAAE